MELRVPASMKSASQLISHSDAVATVDASPSIYTKDVTLNQNSGIFARIFLPPTSSASAKLPILVYFHGGGFVSGSTTHQIYHDFVSKLAVAANTLIVSVEYRLAPAHRLPVAYDDCFEALMWLHEQAKLQYQGKPCEAHGMVVGEKHTKLPDGTVVEEEPWLAAHADFSKCFLGGESAGANITHNVAMRAGSKDWKCLRVKGMMVIHPFLGGSVPTEDEEAKPLLALVANMYWTLSLPLGAELDHPACNPLSPAAPPLKDASLPPALVAVATDDVLRARGVNYFEALKEAGKDASLFTSENEGHTFFLLFPDSQNARALLQEMVVFLNN